MCVFYLFVLMTVTWRWRHEFHLLRHGAHIQVFLQHHQQQYNSQSLFHIK